MVKTFTQAIFVPLTPTQKKEEKEEAIDHKSVSELLEEQIDAETERANAALADLKKEKRNLKKEKRKRIKAEARTVKLKRLVAALEEERRKNKS